MFISLLILIQVSPAIAKQCGWSEDKNTTLDTQCNISIVGASGKTQYVRLPILVSNFAIRCTHVSLGSRRTQR